MRVSVRQTLPDPTAILTATILMTTDMGIAMDTVMDMAMEA